jgi:ADP-ribosyl-[dinitrogen reductase] hydrolase
MFALYPRIEITSLLAACEPNISLKSRFAGAYLGLAVGDALGATLEFLTPREIRERHGVHRDIIGGGWLRLGKGQVTDDTEMSLALGGNILNAGRVDSRSVAEAFSLWMRSKPADIGGTVRRGISLYRRTG